MNRLTVRLTYISVIVGLKPDLYTWKEIKKRNKKVDNEGGQFLIDIEDITSKVGVLSNLEIDSTCIIPLHNTNLNPNVNKLEGNNSL